MEIIFFFPRTKWPTTPYWAVALGLGITDIDGVLDLILFIFFSFIFAYYKCAQIAVHLAESPAKTSTVHKAEESREQKAQEEEPRAVEAEEAEEPEHATEETAEQAFPPDQSEPSEQQANTQYSGWWKTHLILTCDFMAKFFSPPRIYVWFYNTHNLSGNFLLLLFSFNLWFALSFFFIYIKCVSFWTILTLLKKQSTCFFCFY